MTADNLTFALEIDFIPDLQEGRDDFKKKMKSVAEKIDGSYTYYLDHENYQSLEEFIDSMGYEAFRDTVLGNTMSDMNGNENYYGSSWGMPNVPPLNEGDFVRPEHNIMQVIEVYPEMGQFLMEYGMSCVGCFVSYDENLWQAAQTLGMDVFELIGEINEYLADKFQKPLLTENTPMEEILSSKMRKYRCRPKWQRLSANFAKKQM